MNPDSSPRAGPRAGVAWRHHAHLPSTCSVRPFLEGNLFVVWAPVFVRTHDRPAVARLHRSVSVSDPRRSARHWLLWGVVLVLVGAGLCPGTGRAQPDASPPEASYVHRHWTTADGLPVNTMRDLAQGPQGYLWMATYASLVRFDGVEFSTMTAATSDLPTNRPQTLQVGPEGDLWSRTEGEQMIQIDPRRRIVVGTYRQRAGRRRRWGSAPRSGACGAYATGPPSPPWC